MWKKLALPFFVVSFLLVTFAASFVVINAQNITLTEKKVVYDLPYPGLLPDHPLYFLKKWRDKVLDLTTRENIKKAELYLLFSDKKINTAVLLVDQKGKSKLAIQNLLDGERYASKIPGYLKKSTEQGASPTAQLVEKIKLSNNKHREVIQQLMKSIPQDEQTQMETALKMNAKVKNELNKL